MIESDKVSVINNQNLFSEDAEDQFNIEPIAKRLNIAEVKAHFIKLRTGQASNKLVWLMGHVDCFLKKESYLYVFDDHGFIKVLVDKSTSLFNILKSGDLVGVLGNFCRSSNGELIIKQHRILIISSENCLAKVQTKKSVLKESASKTEKIETDKKSLNIINIVSEPKNENLEKIKINCENKVEIKNEIIKAPEIKLKEKNESIAKANYSSAIAKLDPPLKIKKKNKINPQSLIYGLALANLFFLSGQAMLTAKVYNLIDQQRKNLYDLSTRYYAITKEEIPLINNQSLDLEPKEIEKPKELFETKIKENQEIKTENKIKNKIRSEKGLKENKINSSKKIIKKLPNKIIEKVQQNNKLVKIGKTIINSNDLEFVNSSSKEDKEMQSSNSEKVLFKPIQLPEAKEPENQIKILGNEQDLNQYSQYQTQIIKPAREVKTSEIEKLISKTKTPSKGKKSIYFFSDLIENSKNRAYKNQQSESFENNN